MSTNPSHILIARNSRGHNNPSASLSSPAETHAAASGIFRSSGTPPWLLQECDTDDIVSELSTENDDDKAIDVDETFTKHSHFPGTIKVVVESTTFWAHKEVLFFSSPFFEAALSGNWSETGRPPSMSSVITISQPPSIPGAKTNKDKVPEMTFTPMENLNLPVDFSRPLEADGQNERTDEKVSSEKKSAAQSPEGIVNARKDSLATLESDALTRNDIGSILPDKRIIGKRWGMDGVDAVIVLKEERASTFHDFLKFVYPHLECTITWNNVESLMNISHKLCVLALQRECLTFLLTHAAGRPIKAMRIAELFEEEELYREASRFVLDNPGGWTDEELGTLSQTTLLKLEKRRNWFLERVLKLGLTMIAKEYECCQNCPDPQSCARLLEEKWRQAYHAVFRFGPPQPSMVFRYLRQLEGISPPLALTQTACQASAKAFTSTFFDRMFSLGIRGSGADLPLTAPRASATTVAGATTGPRRHFLFCVLKHEYITPKVQRSRSDV